MDPLYANYDKRKKTLEENSAPVPQSTPNSMPVFGAAAAPAPMPASAPAEAPAPTPVQEPATPSPEPVVPAPTSFEQQFEQMVDGTAPAQLTQPQQQFNPNYTGTGDIVLNLDQPKKKLNMKIVIAIVAIFGVAIFAIIMIALRAPRTTSQGNDKQAVKNFIEYFVFGTEGTNEVTDEIMNSEPTEFMFYKNMNSVDHSKSSGYEKIITDFIKNETLETKINIYGEVSRDLYTDVLVRKYIEDEKNNEKEYGDYAEFVSIIEDKKEYEKFMMDFYAQMKEECDYFTSINVNECYNDDFVSDNIELVKEENKLNRRLRTKKEELYSEIIEDVQKMWQEIK